MTYEEGDMDLQPLAQQIVTFLAPFLPYLLKAGEKAAEEVGERIGGEAWDQAERLWGRLRPKVGAKVTAQEAATDVAEHPDDEDAQAALRLQLKKLLAEDETLATEVARLLEEARTVGVTIIAPENSVVISGSVNGSVIVTGDRNVVQQDRWSVQLKGKYKPSSDCADDR